MNQERRDSSSSSQQIPLQPPLVWAAARDQEDAEIIITMKRTCSLLQLLEGTRKVQDDQVAVT